jgi:hypothetical protein
MANEMIGTKPDLREMKAEFKECLKTLVAT